MKYSRIKGYTLIEAMVVVALLGVLATWGLPTYRTMMVRTEIVDTTNDMIISLKRARAEALKRGRDIRVCSSTDGKTCSGTADNWVKGWLVFVDLDNDGLVDEPQGELIWVKEMSSTTGLTVVTTNVAHATAIDFSYTGTLAAGVAGGFQVCSGFGTDGHPRRDITISVSGDVSFNKNTSVKC